MASARAFLRLSLIVAVAGCGLLRPPPPLHPEGPKGAWYVVQPGETLAQIATRTHVPIEDLREINGLGKEEAVVAGRMLFLLDAESLTSAPAPTTPQPPTIEAPPPTVSGTQTPLRWPLADPRMSSPFGARQGGVHEGIDLAAPTGTPILAAQAGQVLYAGDAVRGYGNMIVLQHGGDLLTVYAHSSVLLVRTGETIAAGQEIARVGQSGRATAPHLHFEVRRGQVPQDPLRFLPPLSER